jgi:hypothetical protein
MEDIVLKKKRKLTQIFRILTFIFKIINNNKNYKFFIKIILKLLVRLLF